LEDERPRLIDCPKCGYHTFEVSHYFDFDKSAPRGNECSTPDRGVSYISGECFHCGYFRENPERWIDCPTCGGHYFGIVGMYVVSENHWVRVCVRSRTTDFSFRNSCWTVWKCMSCGHSESLYTREGRVYDILWRKKLPKVERCHVCGAGYLGKSGFLKISNCDDCGKAGCQSCGVRTYVYAGNEWVQKNVFILRKGKRKQLKNLPTMNLCLDCVTVRELENKE
jgi:hypothetical protein